MRFGLDAHHLNGKPQGSRSHLLELIPRLERELSPDDELRVFSFDPEATRSLVPGRHHRVFPESAKLRLPFVVPALELWHRLDLFHAQYLSPPWSTVPQVVTIHDVLFESHPELFRGAFSARSRSMIRRSAERARRVLTVSEFSRRAILEHYRLPDERVVVTPNAVDHERFRPSDAPQNEIRTRYGLERPFVLAVGRLEPRKNIERLVEAFTRLTDVTLAIAGVRDFRSEAVIEAVSRAPEGSIRLLGPVPDADLPDLYRAAEALAYPSLVEGFGMPVLEAMACGTPVLTSSRGALGEVAGEAALYVDPEQPDAIAEGLQTLLGDTVRRSALRALGLARAARFTWEETARLTAAAYREAL